MSWHKLTLKVIDVLALLGHRCLGTHHLTPNVAKAQDAVSPRRPKVTL